MVAASVEPLVVRAGGAGERGEGRDPVQDLLGVGRVAADLGELLVGELAGLVEDPVRDAELADVVQQRRSGAGRRARRRPSPSRAPTSTAYSATRSEWRAVNGDFASMTWANASAMSSSRRSSACSVSEAGSMAATSAATSSSRRRSQIGSSTGIGRNRSASSGSNQRPLRALHHLARGVEAELGARRPRRSGRGRRSARGSGSGRPSARAGCRGRSSTRRGSGRPRRRPAGGRAWRRCRRHARSGSR